MGREYGRRGSSRGRDDDRRGGSSRGRDDDRRGGSSRARGRGRDDDEERDRYPAARRISKIGGECGRCEEPIEVGDQYVLGLDREGGGTCLDCVDDKDEVKPWFPSEESALLIRILRAVEGRGGGRAKTEDPPAAEADEEEEKAPKRSRKS